MNGTIMVFLAIGLSAVTVFWLSVQRRQQRLLASRHVSQSLQVCGLLIRLVGHLQQHRGMSSAWLSGETSFLQRLQEKQTEIARVVPEIMTAARLESQQPCPCMTGNEVSLFFHHWKELLERMPGLTPEQNIAHHSQLISQVLEWLAAFGEARIEPGVDETHLVGAARNFAHRLPLLTECLGQARAIGSSVAARHACAPVARVRLMFLVGRAEALLQQAMVAEGRSPLAEQSRLAIQEMALTIRTRMLLNSGVVVSSSEYFALATRAIDGVFKWMDECAQTLGRMPHAQAGGKPMSGRTG